MPVQPLYRSQTSDRHATYPGKTFAGPPHARGAVADVPRGVRGHRHARRLRLVLPRALAGPLHHPRAAGVLAHLSRQAAAWNQRRRHRGRRPVRLDPHRRPAPHAGMGDTHHRFLRRARAGGVGGVHAAGDVRHQHAGAGDPAEIPRRRGPRARRGGGRSRQPRPQAGRAHRGHAVPGSRRSPASSTTARPTGSRPSASASSSARWTSSPTT